MVLIPSPPLPAQRAYASTVGVPIDLPGDITNGYVANGDAAALANRGFIVVGTVGPTTARPQYPRAGDRHIDLTLSVEVVYDGANWRNPVTGAVV
ncbi:hypothetical protein BJS_05962 [Bradyrhizobium japonicum SEMIA 5079]|nr:hypothetical protein BJS_05962 [Bradyrhizobium japonicum SEMIA 5079]